MITVMSDGSTKEIKSMSLKEMQEFVGGCIEIVAYHFEDNDIIICNEDGIMLNLPKNKTFPRFVGNVISANRSDLK